MRPSLQFHQQGIVSPIKALSDEEIEAEPTAYDFIQATAGQDKRYSVTPRCAATPIPRSTGLAEVTKRV